MLERLGSSSRGMMRILSAYGPMGRLPIFFLAHQVLDLIWVNGDRSHQIGIFCFPDEVIIF